MAVPEEVRVGLRAVPARDRDVELGIAPHAVLGDVQARGLDVLLDADAPQPVQAPEAAERGREGEAADGDEAERLDPELVEAAGVDQPSRARGEIGRASCRERVSYHV